MSNVRTLTLTSPQVELLLKYGYPFPRRSADPTQQQGLTRDHHIAIGDYWVELMVGDLVRSSKQIRDRGLLDELDALSTALETALSNYPKSEIID